MVHGLGVPSLGCPREVCLALWRLTRRCDETRPNSWARKEKDCCGGGYGGVTGVVLVAVSMPFLLGAAARAGYSGAPPRRRRQNLSDVAATAGCAGARYLAPPQAAPPAKPRTNRPPARSIRGCERAMAARRTRNRRLDPGLVGPRQPRVSDDRHPEVVDGAGRWRERRRDCSKARGSEEAGCAGCRRQARRG